MTTTTQHPPPAPPKPGTQDASPAPEYDLFELMEQWQSESTEEEVEFFKTLQSDIAALRRGSKLQCDS